MISPRRSRLSSVMPNSFARSLDADSQVPHIGDERIEIDLAGGALNEPSLVNLAAADLHLVEVLGPLQELRHIGLDVDRPRDEISHPSWLRHPSKTNSTNARAVSVLPIPVGPRKRRLPWE